MHPHTKYVRVHILLIREPSFLCRERTYLMCTICLRGKTNDYFKGLLSSIKNEEKLIRTKIIFGTWIYVKSPGFQPENDIIAPKVLSYSKQTSKANGIFLFSPVVLGYWNVLRLEFFFPSACQSQSIGKSCPPDYVKKDLNRHRRVLFNFRDVLMEAERGTTMYLLQIWKLK